MKTIALYSIKGGVGKTAAAVNLAYAAAESGKRTLLVDLDPQGASSFYFRVRPARKLKAKGFFKNANRVDSSIRGSDFERLDILPANLDYRRFDIMLNRMHRSRGRLKKMLKGLGGDYDIAVLDCPPNIGVLSENVFVAAGIIAVPVIPTTLSERTFEQLRKFFKKKDYPISAIRAFSSMVQTNNRLHQETMHRLHARYKCFLNSVIPLSVDIERMGIRREPVFCYAPTRPGALAYRTLCTELLAVLESASPYKQN